MKSTEDRQAAWREATARYRKAHPEKDVEYLAAHQVERRAYMSAYYIDNKESIAAVTASYRKNNRAAISTAKAEYYTNNREHILARNAAWYVANPDKRRDYDATRRAHELNQFVEDVDRQIVFLNDNGICQWQYCSEASPFVDPANWHLDHIVPLSKGGEHSYANTQVMHPTCNIKKGVS